MDEPNQSCADNKTDNFSKKIDMFLIEFPGFCRFKAEHREKLQVHVLTMHEGKNPHQCSKCNESFKVKDQLLKHTAFVHESGKFKCNSCDAQFSFKNLLKEHNVEIHGKVRTSRCSICRLAFATKPLLKQHKKFVH